MKKIYLIPGYKHDIKTPGYMELIKKLENLGYEVCFVEISWKFRVMSDYIQQAELQIQESENTEILGFSFGAMIALKLSEKHVLHRVFLCSLSPYFSEDLHLFPKYYKLRLGVRRWNDFRDNYHESDIQNRKSNTLVSIYGLDEPERLQQRAEKMIKNLKINHNARVLGVGHDIAHKKYLEAIIGLI